MSTWWRSSTQHDDKLYTKDKMLAGKMLAYFSKYEIILQRVYNMIISWYVEIFWYYHDYISTCQHDEEVQHNMMKSYLKNGKMLVYHRVYLCGKMWHFMALNVDKMWCEKYYMKIQILLTRFENIHRKVDIMWKFWCWFLPHSLFVW